MNKASFFGFRTLLIVIFLYSRGVRADASLVPPIRQTASIFKQPVTVIKTQEGKVKTDFKHGPPDKPKQVCVLFTIENVFVN